MNIFNREKREKHERVFNLGEHGKMLAKVECGIVKELLGMDVAI
jgi:hypothetical protein